jgi:hypothetical protein
LLSVPRYPWIVTTVALIRKHRSGSRPSKRIPTGNRCEEPSRPYRIGRATLHLFCVQSLKQFPRTALNPVAQQFPVLAHSLDRRAGEVDHPLIRGHAQYPIVFARDPPARRNAAAVLILECLHDLELKIGDPLQKLLYPIFETTSTRPVVMTNRLPRTYRSRPRPAAPSRPPPRNLPLS